MIASRPARLAALLVALASLGLAGAASVRAAEPTPVPTVGGALSVANRTITITSRGNVPARIAMSATDVSVAQVAFTLDPGASRDVAYTGPVKGSVSATFTALSATGESGSATLTVNLIPGKAPPPQPDFTPLGLGAAAVLALALLARRLRPWQWRITRTG